MNNPEAGGAPSQESRHDFKNADSILINQSVDDVREAQEQRSASRLQEIDAMADKMREKLRTEGKLSPAEDMVLGKLLTERGEIVATQEGRTLN